jgi:hypothetical protein
MGEATVVLTFCSEETMKKSLATLAALCVCLTSPACAQQISDGIYVDWEEDYVVDSGRLVRCSGAGKPDSSCNGIQAKYQSDSAIRINGRLVCKGNPPRGMGAPGSGGAYCTENGWKY